MLSFEDFFTTTFYFYYDRLHPYLQYREPLSGWKHTGALVQQVFLLLSILYAVLGQILQVYIGYSQTKDIVIVTESLSWIIIGLISLDICATLTHKTKDLVNILWGLKANYSKDRDLEKRIPISELHEEIVKIFKAFQRTHIAIYLGKILLPLFLAIFGYAMHRTWEFNLALNVWYPVDREDPFVTPFLYLFECWVIFACSGPMVAFCAFLGGIASVICVQYMELANDFKHLQLKRGNYCQDSVNLIKLVKRHLRLIELSEQMKEIFTDFFLQNYVLSSVGIGVFMFVTVTSNNPVIILEFISESICFITYISTLSLFGQRLIEHVRTLKNVSSWWERFIKIIYPSRAQISLRRFTREGGWRPTGSSSTCF